MFSKTPFVCCLGRQILRSRNQCLLISTSSAVESSFPNWRNTKKKLIKPVTLTKKSISPIVEIKNKMTVDELALLLNRSHDMIFEALAYITGAEHYKKNDEVIDNVSIIKQVVSKCGYRYKLGSAAAKPLKPPSAPKHDGPNLERLKARVPVVSIMGHVDHGKTTLLDALRSSNIVAQEFGGITQHIGAFSVKTASGKSQITFLDTPGHAVFSAMRERGTMMTDLVVLVVAADDGVMKQTEECIRFAHEAKVPIIVAINKCDKSTANVKAAMDSLLRHGVQLEELGGSVQSVNISALKKDNLQGLLECIEAQAELLQLQADEKCHVEAVCVESCQHQHRGKLATVLIQHGTLKKGDVLVAGKTWCKVRGLLDEQGVPMQSALPGTAVQVMGWKSLPSAGHDVLQVPDEQEAKRLVALAEATELEKKVQAADEVIKLKMEQHHQEYSEERRKRLELGHRVGKTRLKTKEISTDDSPRLSLVLKGDVDGSLEAILDVLDTYNSKQCRLDLLSYGVGAPTESDVEVASLFNGTIYNFNLSTSDRVLALAKRLQVPVMDFNVIYRLFAHLRQELEKKLPSLPLEKVSGEAQVLASFTVTEAKRKVSVAGCRCVKGVLNKKLLFKLLREGEVLLQGKLQSLKHHKNEVDSIKTDVECGVSFSDQSHQPRPGDQIVCYELVPQKQKLEWDLDFL